MIGQIICKQFEKESSISLRRRQREIMMIRTSKLRGDETNNDTDFPDDGSDEWCEELAEELQGYSLSIREAVLKNDRVTVEVILSKINERVRQLPQYPIQEIRDSGLTPLILELIFFDIQSTQSSIITMVVEYTGRISSEGKEGFQLLNQNNFVISLIRGIIDGSDHIVQGILEIIQASIFDYPGYIDKFMIEGLLQVIESKKLINLKVWRSLLKQGIFLKNLEIENILEKVDTVLNLEGNYILQGNEEDLIIECYIYYIEVKKVTGNQKSKINKICEKSKITKLITKQFKLILNNEQLNIDDYNNTLILLGYLSQTNH